jgi:hypothetical protein
MLSDEQPFRNDKTFRGGQRWKSSKKCVATAPGFPARAVFACWVEVSSAVPEAGR